MKIIQTAYNLQDFFSKAVSIIVVIEDDFEKSYRKLGRFFP